MSFPVLSSLGTSVLCFIIMVLASSVIIFLLKWWCLLVMYLIMDLMNDISSENVAISLLPKSLKDSISSSMTESQIKVFDYTTNIIIVLVILYYLTVVFHSFFHTKDNKNNKDNKDFKDYIHVVGNRKLFNKIAQISMSSSFVVILALVVFNVYSHDILSKWFKLSKE